MSLWLEGGLSRARCVSVVDRLAAGACLEEGGGCFLTAFNVSTWLSSSEITIALDLSACLIEVVISVSNSSGTCSVGLQC